MAYGMPYMGSKSKIAKDIIKCLPSAEYFVDLFGGGGAMTCCAIESGKYKTVVYNEKEKLVYDGFNMAINGDFITEKRWISREDFDKLKSIDPYVAICYSFGNSLTNYLYSALIEPWKEALHYARIFKDYSKLRQFGIYGDGGKIDIANNFTSYKQKYCNWMSDNINADKQHFGELEHIERLNRLEHIERLNRKNIEIKTYNLSYEQLQLPNNSIIYCDPPYKDTKKYLSNFDHDKFYTWLRNNENLIFISEYNMPNDFYEIANFSRIDTYKTNSKRVTEKLFCNKPYKIVQSIKLF